MRKFMLAAPLILIGLLAACGNDTEKAGGGKTSGQVTQTRMDDIDSIEGTINDDMINVDETTDIAPLAKDDGKGSAGSNSGSAKTPSDGSGGDENGT
ncbi:MAG: hypothetical protein V3V15_01575 [Sphingorhabdus sp.]